jgi:NADH-quinone oxidoreductase subunit C
VAVTLPEGDLQGRLERYLEGLRNRHGLEESGIDGDVVRVVPTVTHIYPTANWHEREAYDMFGVAFAGHPDLRRLYMWQDHFDHHPLLKSFQISTRRTFEGLR